MLTVSKFGGSSLAGSDGLNRCAAICTSLACFGSLVVVVSARGCDTDLLISEAGMLSSLSSSREHDALLSTGELRSAALLAMLLREKGVNALSLTGAQAGILTDDCYGNSEILSIDSSRISFLLSHNFVPVVCGFQGADSTGSFTTLGRGGSDTTAAALAAALNADECRIYTDVDGVYTADPSLCSNAALLSAIDSFDMLTLARYGAGVLHPRASEIVFRDNIPTRILSSLHSSEGTLISHLPSSLRPDFVGITMSGNTVTVVGNADFHEVKEMFEYILQREGYNPLMLSMGDNFISLTFAPNISEYALRLLHSELFG